MILPDKLQEKLAEAIESLETPLDASNKMYAIVWQLPRADREKFIKTFLHPFVKTFYEAGKLSADDIVWLYLHQPRLLAQSDRMDFVTNFLIPIIKDAYSKGVYDAKVTFTRLWLDVKDILSAREQDILAETVILPFLQKAYQTGDLTANDVVNRMFVMSKNKFDTDKSIFLKTVILPFLQKTYINGSMSEDEAFEQIGKIEASLSKKQRIEIGLSSLNGFYKSLTTGSARKSKVNKSPSIISFLRASEAVEIEQETPGFFAALPKLFKAVGALKPPEVS